MACPSKGAVPDFRHFCTLRHINSRQTFCLGESAIVICLCRIITSTDSFQIGAFLKSYGFQRGTIIECRCFNCFYTGRNFNRGQCFARYESAMIIRRIITSTDSLQIGAFLKGYSCQFGTILNASCSIVSTLAGISIEVIGQLK